MRMKMFCWVLSFILISLRRNSWFFSHWMMPFQHWSRRWRLQYQGLLQRQSQHCRASSREPQISVLTLLLSPVPWQQPCLQNGTAGKGDCAIIAWNPLNIPGFWLRGRGLGVSHPHVNMNPFRWNVWPSVALLAMSCRSQQGIHLPCISVPRCPESQMRHTNEMLQLQVSVFVLHHHSWEVPRAAHLSHTVQHGQEGWPTGWTHCVTPFTFSLDFQKPLQFHPFLQTECPTSG